MAVRTKPPLAALFAILALPLPALAPSAGPSSMGSYQAGYDGSRYMTAQPRTGSTRDANGNRLIVDGIIQSGANAYSSASGEVSTSFNGAGNDLSVGNNDIYPEIDATRLNSGGVVLTATFSGTNGFDAYVGADAVGNSVNGYACSECRGYRDATTSQTNSGDVSARATTTVAGSGRAVITGANATGNSAPFHVSR